MNFHVCNLDINTEHKKMNFHVCNLDINTDHKK